MNGIIFIDGFSVLPLVLRFACLFQENFYIWQVLSGTGICLDNFIWLTSREVNNKEHERDFLSWFAVLSLELRFLLKQIKYDRKTDKLEVGNIEQFIFFLWIRCFIFLLGVVMDPAYDWQFDKSEIRNMG